MDIPVVGGVILCPLCRQLMTALRTYPNSPLRTIHCSNPKCRSQLMTGPVHQELSHYNMAMPPLTLPRGRP
jgi:hypothetical protein